MARGNIGVVNYFVTTMNRLSGINAITVVLLLILPVIAQSTPPTHSLSEDSALALLHRTLKRDHIYEKRISLDCVAYGTEEKTNDYFQFVLREIHDAKCDGDPQTSPALDRYRVYRHSGKIKQWKAAEDKWQAYRAAKPQ